MYDARSESHIGRRTLAVSRCCLNPRPRALALHLLKKVPPLIRDEERRGRDQRAHDRDKERGRRHVPVRRAPRRLGERALARAVRRPVERVEERAAGVRFVERRRVPVVVVRDAELGDDDAQAADGRARAEDTAQAERGRDPREGGRADDRAELARGGRETVLRRAQRPGGVRPVGWEGRRDE